MNAFPPELLHHHFACMVVAGLTPPTKPTSTVTATPAAAATSDAAPTVDPSSASPSSAPANSAPTSSIPADHPTAAFPDLAKALHDILASRARNTVWDPSRGRAAVFHTVFADHGVRLPPLKTKPSARHVPPIAAVTTGSPSSAPSEPATAAFAALPPRSPLSPLHPNSPQFPDGLIAPVWVRKHRELVPSVFVSLHCLPLSTAASPPTPEELRNADEALIKVISDRRRTLAERGIKLTIVLLTHKHMLDDAQLEARLSYIRRSSGLDSRASLFVLTPVSRPELGEFVSSLHGALFEPAADYYREHARRVKRKRTRYPPPPSILQPVVTALGTLPPASAAARTVAINDVAWLSREGWIVRSEYKLAVFAELAGDMHEALVRYRDAYELLCCSPSCLLGSTLMLPPRTKRWAEAKVLADTLCMRIAKLMLYADDGEGAAAFFRRHLARFTDLSTGWGIGAMTFEYWSWLAKQYRMFAELVEHATRPVPGAPLPPFQLAVHAPPLPSRLLHPDALPAFSDGRGGVVPPPGMLLPNQNAVAAATSPYASLQSAGAYFYLAALCTLERRARFVKAMASAETGADEDAETSPLAHERKVDHTAQITETLTKAYDAFKRTRQHRAALLVAARIATAYHDGAQHAMALKFLERILRSYAKDGVRDVRAGLVDIAAQAAVAAGDRPAALRMLAELLDSSLPFEDDRRAAAVHALKTLILQAGDAQDNVEEEDREDAEAGKGVATVAPGMWGVEVVLPVAEVEFGASLPFQVVLRNLAACDAADVMSIDSIALHVRSGDEARETVVRATGSATSSSDAGKPVVVDLGEINTSEEAHAVEAALDAALSPRGVVAFQGALKPDAAGAVLFERLVIRAHAQSDSSRSLPVEFDLVVGDANSDSFERGEGRSGLREVRWLLSSGRSVVVAQRTEPDVAHVRPQRFDVGLSVRSDVPAGMAGYVDERIAIRIVVTNQEKTDVVAWLDAALQPSYDGARDALDYDAVTVEEATAQAVKGIEAGTVRAGGESEVVVWLTPAQAGGTRTIDVALRVVAPEHSKAASEERMHEIPVAVSQRLVIPVAALFEARTWTKPLPHAKGNKKRAPALLDWDEADEAVEEKEMVGLDIEMVGADDDAIEVVGVELVRDDVAVGEPLADVEAEALGRWMGRDRFSFVRVCRREDLQWRVQWRRRDDVNTTLVRVSPAQVAGAEMGVTVTLSYAQAQRLQRPFDVDVVVENHHATRSVALALSLDTDPHFTSAAARHLTLPHILPGQQKTLRALARLVPQSIGVRALPNLTVALLDPANLAASLATRHSSSPREGELPDAIRFAYSAAGVAQNVDRLPPVVVSL